jgi:hypothetical protein
MISKDFLTSLLGLEREAAEKTIASYTDAKLTTRITRNGNEWLAATMEVVENRINLEIVDGRVDKASEG